jgi:signal transduction histidine kinase
MKLEKNAVQEKLYALLVERSQSVSVAFSLASIPLIIFPLVSKTDTVFYIIYIVALLSLTPINILRYFAAAKLINVPNNRKYSTLLDTSIILNVLCISFFLISTCWSITTDTHHVAIPIVILVAVTAGSITSLSLIPIMFKIFIFFDFLLPVLIFVIKGIVNREFAFISISLLLLGFLIFVVKSANLYYENMRKMFIYELEIYNSNQLLTQKLNELVDAQSEIASQKERADSASKLAAIGEMSKGMAHEINNPLAVIQGNLRLIQKNILGLETLEQKDQQYLLEKTDKINLSVNRIVKVINSLKLFTGQDEDASQLSESFDFNEIVENVLALTGEKFSINNIALFVEKIPHNRIFGNKNHLVQVLFNLLNNAYDALIGVTNAKITIKSELNADFLKILVIDNGEGINEKEKLLVFLPFYTTKEIGQGSGLGLSLSKGIVEKLGGQLVLENSNLETIFSFSIPLEKS